jgi:hypothetical protein
VAPRAAALRALPQALQAAAEALKAEAAELTLLQPVLARLGTRRRW